MADTFYREPINHGDLNVYHNYVMLQLRCGGRGGLSMELYNNAGALELSPGYAGIDDGVTKGTIERTAVGALSIAGVSSGNWASIEASVAGSVVTWHVEDIAGATTKDIPASVVAAYDYLKGGYYLVATRRLIGIAYKNADASLGIIVNCQNGKNLSSLGRLHYLPLGNTTNRAAVNGVAPPTVGNWSAAISATGFFGVPLGAKAIRVKIFLDLYAAAAGTASLALCFSDNNSNVPAITTAHPEITLSTYESGAGHNGALVGEIDIPLNSAGQFYLYTLVATNITIASCLIYVTVVGYYMGD